MGQLLTNYTVPLLRFKKQVEKEKPPFSGGSEGEIPQPLRVFNLFQL
jgi:hypothetical protein